MDLSNIKISAGLVPSNYVQLGLEAQRVKQRELRELVEKRKLPEKGWPDKQIEELVHQLSSLDSNNFEHKVGLGEREGRIACNIVARRHYNFGHGIGRSGDLLEAQPKAAGSTLLANLTNALLLDFIRTVGVSSCYGCILVPMATGMTLTLCLLTLRRSRPNAKYVLWSRIDQKSCFKAIIASGLEPLIISGKLNTEGHSLSTDLVAFKEQIDRLGADNILCLYSTTSCFAPRNPDDIVAIAELAKTHQLPHLVNNAYGLQCTKITHMLEQANRVGRIDYFVQSTDKNLLVPVGGAFVGTFNEQMLKELATTYPGRASSSQTLDVFMTLLCLGRKGILKLIAQRKNNFRYLKERLLKLAGELGEDVPNTKDNRISLALTLKNLQELEPEQLTNLGAKLYIRGVSGVRVVTITGKNKSIANHQFTNFGAHNDKYPYSYLTAAAGLGIDRSEIDHFVNLLQSTIKEMTDTKVKHSQ